MLSGVPAHAQESQSAVEDLRRLRSTFHLAPQVGPQLVGSQVLLEALSLRAAAEDGVTDSLGASAAARRNPDHTITIAPSGQPWVAMLGDLELARSDRALLLSEASYPPVVYFPPDDVHTEALEPSDTSTHCPFKGDASYWASEIDGKPIDVAWYYPRTFDEVMPIAGYIAFYSDRVVVSEASKLAE